MATTNPEALAGSWAGERFEDHPPHERRHGDRRSVRIPLLVDVGGLRDAAWTAIANEGGALIVLPRSVAEGERVVVHNVTTGRTAVARVIASRPAGTRSGGAPGFRVALRLETYPEYFWGPAYYAVARAVH